ncbi:DNA-binding transcriptional activator BglJ [Leclercia adecarboxylata]|uniref:DNA-binding transcriptional activator BglJ n=1 Tax=Leclercia adecarboxylata TaxID=83655 RepID=A0A9X4BEP9_9ENTR|nr:DNA-binding transcriptional activator BglJ [Leclercia adecarboxylata]MBD1405705.1 DNA-binding transcriptional activator BglJ [Leclercia adecarboxylata]MDC6623841.1 DNA-binding transcriptional activator BglJ [Leclercia adecarboxylata]MDC6632663.1 DNA-binding transcriptional activator BglJ [Leclercia adecarboxylata]MDC6639848.1 DNA-binding transcriptional activator BglJ [Leclercia adecarboxylata]MDC6651762.1 DNA-binding transcriptional activator BglJ [Leclercia adecarboxylata]
MSAMGLKHLFANPSLNGYEIHLFSNIASFQSTLNFVPYSSLIYSLSDEREERRNCLVCLKEVAATHGMIQRIVLASDAREASLMNQLSPSRLHGIVLKSDPLPALQEQLGKLLNETRRVNDSISNHWNIHRGRLLSPTERAILQFMSCGFSIQEIATRLERNIKTIRAHKFNAMMKLGVHSDVGLLDAADILTHFPVPDHRMPRFLSALQS